MRRQCIRLRVAQEGAHATRAAGAGSQGRRPGLALVWACGVGRRASVPLAEDGGRRAGRGCNGGEGVEG